MATSNHYLANGFQIAAADDDSIASNDTDDGRQHIPEKILTHQDIKHVNNESIWYLVKWENCSILRSSWETGDLFKEYPRLLEDWNVELKKRAEGKSKFDLLSFNKAVEELENAERQRRRLRTLKKDVAQILSIAAST